MARVAMCQDVMVEYMGFMCMASFLKKAGHTVELFFDDQTNEDKFAAELAAFKPDILCFSILSPSLPWSLKIGKRMKKELGAVTVYGNVHAILSPDDIIHNEGVDIVCVGEGENAMLELCEAIDKKQDYSAIKDFWVKKGDELIKNPMREGLVDLNEMPFHDRTIYNKYGFFRNSKYLRLLQGRGCPFRCTFCSNPILYKHFGGRQYLRKKTPENAIAEIEHTIANHPTKIKHICFIDEVFWVNNNWLRSFLTLYKEKIRLPFTANFRFGPIEEADIKLMAEAGARAMIVATESGDEAQRKGTMDKPVTNKHIIQVAEWMHKYGIKFSSSCFFGLPGDTIQDHVNRLEFYRQVNPTYLWTTFFQPYPGLLLTQNMDVQKYIPETAEEKEFKVTLHHDMYLNLPDRDRLVNLKKVYFLCVKFPRLTPMLVWLTQFRIPFLFDILFGLHFTYYAFMFENISFYQFLIHVKIMGLNPILRKKQPLQNIGRPFIIPWKKKAKALAKESAQQIGA